MGLYIRKQHIHWKTTHTLENNTYIGKQTHILENNTYIGKQQIY